MIHLRPSTLNIYIHQPSWFTVQSTKSLPTERRVINALLIISFLSFLVKGIDYLLLGRALPISVGLVFLIFLWLGIQFSQRLYKFAIFTWSIVLIGWSLVRLLLSMVVHFTTGIDEVHVRSQFGFWGIATTLLFLVMGVSFLVYRPWKYLQK